MRDKVAEEESTKRHSSGHVETRSDPRGGRKGDGLLPHFHASRWFEETVSGYAASSSKRWDSIAMVTARKIQWLAQAIYDQIRKAGEWQCRFRLPKSTLQRRANYHRTPPTTWWEMRCTALARSWKTIRGAEWKIVLWELDSPFPLLLLSGGLVRARFLSAMTHHAPHRNARDATR